MRRLLRLLAIMVAGSLALSVAGVSTAVIANAAVHHSASADELTLPSLSSQMQVGSTVYASDGKTVLAVLSGPELRKPVKLSQISKVLITAVLDTEDHRFYLHGGFDIPSIVRALVSDTSGSGLQGGSTIPQQLVKQLYLSPTRKLSRKIKEAVLADRLEQKYSKDLILQAYLNTIYLGNGAYGIEAASETYFHEPASQLNLPQSALLAGMIQNPNGYDPYHNPADARDRRKQVLDRMNVYGDITPAQESAADATPLPTFVAPPATSPQVSNYYVEEIKNELLDSPTSPLGSSYSERYDALFEGGLKIYTNLDPRMQAAAEKAVSKDTPTNSQGFEEAMVSIDPTTGKVRALVGGAASAKFDIVTQGERQPGSGFKLFTLLTALAQGYSVYDSVDGDAPCAIKFPGNTDLAKKPIKNDTTTEGGIQSLIQATANSVNCAYIRLAHEVGLANVVAMAQKLGVSEITSTDQYIPSMVIGTIAVHPIEMAAAYAALADGGVYHRPTFIDHVLDRSGSDIYDGSSPGVRVFSTQVAAEADVAFQAVVQRGTGTAAELWNRPVAGKTGTTENNVDAWFNGYTPQLESTVWIGNEADETPIVINGYAVYGAGYPAETWRDFSSTALSPMPIGYFPVVSNGLLPPTRYITSPSLVADDVLDHNGGYYNGYGYNGSGYNGSGNGGYYRYPTSTSSTLPSHGHGSKSTTTAPGVTSPTSSFPPTSSSPTSGPPTSSPPTTAPPPTSGAGG